MSTKTTSERVAALITEYGSILESTSGEAHWQWMDRRPIPKKDANKFLLLAMIDFQWKTETASRKAQDFAEVELGDPDDLWERILRISKSRWASRVGHRSLHRTSTRHAKVRTMARTMVSQYGGDARRLWADRSPGNTLDRLEALGLGPQLSRMTVGALLDEEQLDGGGDVKPDVHLRRVLGRVLAGREFSPEEVISATRAMRPDDRWPLDWPTWHIGHTWCHKHRPDCPLRIDCLYFNRRGTH
jgi:endonuclease III